jgi:hypothetical protein
MAGGCLIFQAMNLFVIQGLNVINVIAVHLRDFSNFVNDRFLKLHAVGNWNVAIDSQYSHFLLQDLDEGRDTRRIGPILLESST